VYLLVKKTSLKVFLISNPMYYFFRNSVLIRSYRLYGVNNSFPFLLFYCSWYVSMLVHVLALVLLLLVPSRSHPLSHVCTSY